MKNYLTRSLFRRFLTAALAAGGTMIVSARAGASTVVEDSFEGTDEVDKVSAVESKTTWESPSGRQFLAVMADEHLGPGKSLAVLNGIAYARIPDTELEIGSTLTLSFRFRSLEHERAYPLPVRIGLCQNQDGIPDTGETKGYWLVTGPGADAKSGITFENNTDSSLGGGNDGESVGACFQLNYDWSEPQKLTLKFSRPSQDLVEITTRLDDGPEQTVRDSKASVTSFNLLAIRIANTPQSRFLVDDLKIEKTTQ